ncbi:MAG: chemotaxis protein CheA, partial [Pseudobdellovibrionaceae bacterium]
DDGGGINRQKVLKKAVERNLIAPGVDPDSLSDDQVFQFIFSAGFSTADKVSDLSGRGVGLDVVRSNLEKINGKIHISSKLEQGTTFRLTIPLTTAITDGIVVALAGERYILPIHSIREIVQVTPKDYVEISKAGKVVKVRDALVPVINIANILGFVSQGKQTSSRRDESMLVVIESLNEQMAMPVDEILGQAQVVVKPVATGQNIPEVAGAAILGDGRTVLILDPAMIVAQAVHTTKEVLPPKVAAA